MSTRKPKPRNDAAELLPDPEAVDKLTTFFDSLGPDRSAAVSLYAVDPHNRLRRSFLLTIPDASELDGPELMAQVLERYGAGEYFAESRDTANGQIVFSQRFEVGVLGKRGPVIPAAPAPAAAPAARAGDTSAELVAAINRQSALLERLIAAQAPPSFLDQLKGLKELRDVIAPPPAAPAFDLGKLLELVNGVATLRDSLGDGGGDGGPLSVLARSLAPVLTKIAERAVDSPAALPAPSAPAAPGVTDTASSSSPAGGADVAANETMLKVYVAELVGFAEQGLDAKAATTRIVQTLAGFPESVVQQVLDWLNDEDVVDNLAALDPRAEKHRAWLEQVVDGVLDAALEAEAEPPPAPGPNGGSQPVVG